MQLLLLIAMVIVLTSSAMAEERIIGLLTLPEALCVF